MKHSLYSYFTPYQNKQKCREIVFLLVAALVVTNIDKTRYQPTFESTTLLQMCAALTLMQATEMTAC